MNHSKRILITPLNWGLGHATRCIPVISKILEQNAEVLIASDGRALELLKKEFPNLLHLELPSYNVEYHGKNMVLNMAKQLPNILKTIYKEHKRIKEIITKYNVDVIISDNRYGCFSNNVKSIFLTHQVKIKIPNTFLRFFVNFFNRIFIKKFDTCWVPDYPDEPSLSGELSHGHSLKNVNYVGALSRFKKWDTNKRYDVIAVLSGPEPQRTELEKILIKQARELPHKFLFVLGKTEELERYSIGENIEVVSFLTSKELNEAILLSEIVISRSGYSTIMDLEKTGSRAILIPTPGQTEQEFLAGRFQEMKVFLAKNQEDIDLKNDLKSIETFSGLSISKVENSYLEEAVLSIL